ncbi:MAG: hypothetical protein GXP41_10890 [Chloroflexi bacterium]|nr:hypothetical protein [Chloroflexota bacterium]
MSVDPTLAIESLRTLRPTPANRPAVPAGQAAGKAGASSFDHYLQQAAQHPTSVQFSGHAQRRMAMRGIQLAPADVQRIEQAVDKAAAKGSRDSLVLMDDLALIVDIKNRTVVTAVDGNNRKEGIFTNIDSVVLTSTV